MTDTDVDKQDAPVLGEPTDAAPGPVTSASTTGSGDAESAEQTVDTPDELGGTGGRQAGGAG